jgi:hypothetical protein
MIYVYINAEETKIVYDESVLTTQEKAQATAVVEALPLRQSIPGKKAVLKHNVSQGLYWDYVDLTQEDKERYFQRHVGLGIITPDQYKILTGKDYEAQ